MVVAPVAPMVSMAWVDLMAPELESERERKCSGLARTCCTPSLRIKPFVLLLFRCPLGTVLLMNLHPDATPREQDRSRSLRRVEKLMERELMDAVQLVVNELKGCLEKLVKNELMDCLTKLLGEMMWRKIEVELVRNELMGSAEKGRFESRIAAPWCRLKSCSCCGENNCLDRCLILAHFGGVFGSGGLDLECDGASIGTGDDSHKTGYQPVRRL